MCCSNHVVGGQSDDSSSRGQSLLSDGSARCEYADVVWRGEESISPSSAGDYPHIEQPEHFCMELDKEVRTGSIIADDPSVFRRCSEMELIIPDEFVESLSEHIPKGELHSIEKD